MLTNRVRAWAGVQHFLAICPKEATRRANELLRRDPEQAKTNGEALPQDGFGVSRGETENCYVRPRRASDLTRSHRSHTSPRDTIEEWLKSNHESHELLIYGIYRADCAVRRRCA